MEKFDYASLGTGSIDAWTNNGRLRPAQEEFSERIQGKPVSEDGIKEALLGLTVWQKGWGHGSREVARVDIKSFYATQGLCKVTLYNTGNMTTNATIKWDPEKNVIKPDKTADLEKRVSDLEAQVALLMKALAVKA